jgi:C-terminal processing protease CtpA/Prc
MYSGPAIRITKVEKDSPAAKAGIKVGDVIVGERVDGMNNTWNFAFDPNDVLEQFQQVINDKKPGQMCELIVFRNPAGAPNAPMWNTLIVQAALGAKD